MDLAGIWESPRRQNFQSTRFWWLLIAMCLFLFEALWHRLGGQTLEFNFSKAPETGVETKAPEAEPRVELSPPAEEPASPRSAFRRAKDQRR